MLLNFNNQQPLYLIGKGVSGKEFFQVLVKHGVSNINSITIEQLDLIPARSQCIIAIRDLPSRQAIIDVYKNQFEWPTFVHKLSDVVDLSALGKGIWVDSYSSIGSNASLGDFTVVSSYGCIAHNCKIGKNCFLAPNTMILGSSDIGDNVYFGARCTVVDHICVASDTAFLVNSVVHKNVTDSGTYLHNRKIN